MEPPAKRRRRGKSPPATGTRRRRDNGDGQNNFDDEDDELCFEPLELSAKRDPGYRLSLQRAYADSRFQATMAHIFDKYGRDFEGIGDEIDMVSGEVVVDNGHLQNMRDEGDVGTSEQASDEEEQTCLLHQLLADDDGDESNDDEDDIILGRSNALVPASVPRGPPGHFPSSSSGLFDGLGISSVSAGPFSFGTSPLAFGFSPLAGPLAPPLQPPLSIRGWDLPGLAPRPPRLLPAPGQRYDFPVQDGSTSIWAPNYRFQEDGQDPAPAPLELGFSMRPPPPKTRLRSMKSICPSAPAADKTNDYDEDDVDEDAILTGKKTTAYAASCRVDEALSAAKADPITATNSQKAKPRRHRSRAAPFAGLRVSARNAARKAAAPNILEEQKVEERRCQPRQDQPVLAEASRRQRIAVELIQVDEMRRREFQDVDVDVDNDPENDDEEKENENEVRNEEANEDNDESDGKEHDDGADQVADSVDDEAEPITPPLQESPSLATLSAFPDLVLGSREHLENEDVSTSRAAEPKPPLQAFSHKPTMTIGSPSCLSDDEMPIWTRPNRAPVVPNDIPETPARAASAEPSLSPGNGGLGIALDCNAITDADADADADNTMDAGRSGTPDAIDHEPPSSPSLSEHRHSPIASPCLGEIVPSSPSPRALPSSPCPVAAEEAEPSVWDLPSSPTPLPAPTSEAEKDIWDIPSSPSPAEQWSLPRPLSTQSDNAAGNEDAVVAARSGNEPQKLVRELRWLGRLNGPGVMAENNTSFSSSSSPQRRRSRRAAPHAKASLSDAQGPPSPPPEAIVEDADVFVVKPTSSTAIVTTPSIRRAPPSQEQQEMHTSPHHQTTTKPHTPRRAHGHKPPIAPSSRRSILSLLSSNGAPHDDDDNVDDLDELFGTSGSVSLAASATATTATGDGKSRRRRSIWKSSARTTEVYHTPIRRRAADAVSPGSVIRTPRGTLRACGVDGYRCGRDFCFSCL